MNLGKKKKRKKLKEEEVEIEISEIRKGFLLSKNTIN